MEVNPIKHRKFIGQIPEEEMILIEKACKLEKRTSRISLIRLATVNYAKQIIKRHEIANRES